MNVLRKLTGTASEGTDENGDTHTVETAAPVVQERVHDQYQNIDKTQVEEVHEKIEVVQTVQPLYDQETERTQREVVDHGIEIHEHGEAKLDGATEAELAANREEIARQHMSTLDESVTETSARPDVEVHSRTKIVEEVIPVLQKDIYRPHEIEHRRRVVNVVHDKPVVKGTRVEQPMSVKEFEAKNM